MIARRTGEARRTGGGAMPFPLYRALARTARALGRGAGVWGRSLSGREGAGGRWSAWAREAAPGRTLWFHAASVGEALAVEPVIARLRRELPEARALLTHSSPSLERWPGVLPVDRRDYAPAEHPGEMARAFDALRPDLLVFSRSDLWPEMLHAAHRRGVPVAVAGATVRPGSRRLACVIRPWWRTLCGPIRFVGAVTTADAERWRALGVDRTACVVTGDPRHDQVLERMADLAAVRGLTAWAAGGPVLVAGSVEPGEEPMLFEAFRRVRAGRPDARLLAVPHAPDAPAMRRLARAATRAGIRAAPWPAEDLPGAPAILVSRVGTLADLYLLGTMAYVGGGFSRRGVHSLLEPAAYGLPVIAGPGAGTSPPPTHTLPARHPEQALADRWKGWLTDGGERARAGLLARGALQRGAAHRTAACLLSLLRPSGRWA